ncbi:efflux RND transporter periplasmic adaptor subunit [Cupriavidus metallidurans]|uniref:Efflux RND transporter periplasmic adaptor subunit n=1 Tax=Cupriavidus metallidurans TaxID=119219 RepID=A0A482J0J2_9BURK|nr:efflux RND transporter periplasmic adaptor subunit [Cupriavidus metallidurans]QBP12550.1 efflux RND transporter periplasmic adaptor subunit [Cupriavidus metallidurans]
MAISNKQKAAIAAIVLVGGVTTGAVLLSGRSAPEEHSEHSETTGHGDNEHHGKQAAQDNHKDDKSHDDGEHHETKKGPNGGALFSRDGYDVEIGTAESKGEARIRVWVNKSGKVVDKGVAVTGQLVRTTGETQSLDFVTSGDAMESKQSIEEPHAFDVSADVTLPGSSTPLPVKLSKEEGKIELTAEQVAKTGLVVLTAGPAKVQAGVQFPGEIRFNEDKTAHVVPRLAGVVESVPANIGQQVKKGQVLAVIASTGLSDQRSELLAAQKRLDLARVTYDREKKLWEEKISAEQDYLIARNVLQESQISVQNAQQKLTAIGASSSSSALNRYELRAPFDGMIVEKHISLGEAVADNANVFTLSDLSSVWVEFVVSAKDLEKVRVGKKASITSASSDVTAEGTVSYVGSLLGEETRTAKARVTLTNPQMGWRPGLFVSVNVFGAEADVAVAIDSEGIQQVDGQSVVFVAVSGGFVAQPVKTGRSNGRAIEIVEGIKPGMRYAASNSFVLKSELGKSSAEHSH